MKYATILLFFILFQNTFSQEKIFGTITDTLNNPIEYANIGIANSVFGTITDTKGNFTFEIPHLNRNDTLRISSIGFKTKDILLKEITETNKIVIKLSEDVTVLKELKLLTGNLKSHIEGKSKTETKNRVIFANSKMQSLNLGTEIGRRFDLGTKKPSLLTEFKFYIKENNFESNQFKINIYSIKNSKPFQLLNTENIYVSTSKDYIGWVNINLENYNLIIQEDIIVAVQWIKFTGNGNTLNLPVIIPSLGSTHYYKFGSQNAWEKYGKISSAMVLTFQQ